MFSRCPKCKKSQLLSIQQLKQSRGMQRCSNCHALFDSLESITEQAQNDTEFYLPQADAAIPWNNTSPPKKSRPWGIAFTIGLIFFTVQLIYFEGYALTQSALVRPWLEHACKQLNCQIPVYNNINDFDVLHSSLQESGNQTYNFIAAINNQSQFAQIYPKIKLTLVDFSGSAFAKRIFNPEDYPRPNPGAPLVNSDETFIINLQIVKPKKLIGGYSLSLI